MANLSPSFVTVFPPVVPPAKAYTYRGTNHSSASGAVHSTSIDIGTASADRLVLVMALCQNGPNITSVVCNGVTLTQQQFLSAGSGSGRSFIAYSDLVTSGSGSQNVTVTWASGSFNERDIYVWTLTGLTTNSKQAGVSVQASANGSINVNAGDLLFAIDMWTAGDPNFNGSTETPTGTRNDTFDGNSCTADWVIASTNAAFSIVDSPPSNSDFIAVSFR